MTSSAPGPVTSRRRALWRRPTTATPTLIRRTFTLDVVVIGFATMVSTFWAAGSGDRHFEALRVIGLLCVLCGPAFLRLNRFGPWLLSSITTVSIVMITVGIHLTGGRTTAVLASSFYLIMIVHVFYVYARPVAWLHVGFAATMCVLVLHNNPAVGPPELTILLGTVIAISILVSWLVRAADLADIDFLTGLLNLRGFDSAARSQLDAPSRDRSIALVTINLDDFRTVNERRGHAAGDDLLLSVGRCWQAIVPREASLARRGGDEFWLLVAVHAPTDLDDLLTRMRRGIDGTFSAGIAWSSVSESLSSLISRADAAVLKAKRLGSARTVCAAPADDGQSADDVIRALARDQFALYYQPIIDLRSGVVTKTEALIRWIHPDNGVIAPDDFVARAEQTGAIVALGDWSLATACRDAASWLPNTDGDPITVSINASGLELQDPTYTDRVIAHLADAGLAPARLIIEIVETEYSDDLATVTANLARIAAAGIRLAMDDFGTGHSSLSRLHQTHVDVLKIDRSFITAITDRDQPMPMVTAILAMAKALDLEVVVEGIETLEQAAWLRLNGATYAQGFLYGRPAPQPPNRPAFRLTGGFDVTTAISSPS